MYVVKARKYTVKVVSFEVPTLKENRLAFRLLQPSIVVFLVSLSISRTTSKRCFPESQRQTLALLLKFLSFCTLSSRSCLLLSTCPTLASLQTFDLFLFSVFHLGLHSSSLLSLVNCHRAKVTVFQSHSKCLIFNYIVNLESHNSSGFKVRQPSACAFVTRELSSKSFSSSLMFIYSALLHPNDEVFLAFLRRSMKCLLHRLLFDASFEVLDEEEKASVLEQWVASSSALLLRPKTPTRRSSFMCHLPSGGFEHQPFFVPLASKNGLGNRQTFSPTFFGAKRQKSFACQKMPFKAKKRLFSALALLSSSPI